VRVEVANNEMENAEARMLQDGLKHILLFRTKGFNRRFFNKTKDSLQTVRKWNQVYHPYIREVQMRVLAERANDFSGSTDLHQTAVEPGLQNCTKLFVTGEIDTSGRVIMVKLLSMGTWVQERRIGLDDLQLQSNTGWELRKWYVCAGAGLRHTLLEWLQGRNVVFETFNY
jgi:hypothetical protein